MWGIANSPTSLVCLEKAGSTICTAGSCDKGNKASAPRGWFEWREWGATDARPLWICHGVNQSHSPRSFFGAEKDAIFCKTKLAVPGMQLVLRKCSFEGEKHMWPSLIKSYWVWCDGSGERFWRHRLSRAAEPGWGWCWGFIEQGGSRWGEKAGGGEHRWGVKESSMNTSQEQELMRCEELSLVGVESIANQGRERW